MVSNTGGRGRELPGRSCSQCCRSRCSFGICHVLLPTFLSPALLPSPPKSSRNSLRTSIQAHMEQSGHTADDMLHYQSNIGTLRTLLCGTSRWLESIRQYCHLPLPNAVLHAVGCRVCTAQVLVTVMFTWELQDSASSTFLHIGLVPSSYHTRSISSSSALLRLPH